MSPVTGGDNPIGYLEQNNTLRPADLRGSDAWCDIPNCGIIQMEKAGDQVNTHPSMNQKKTSRIFLGVVKMFLPVCAVCALVLIGVYMRELSASKRMDLALGHTHMEVLNGLLMNEFNVALSDVAVLSQGHEMIKFLEGDRSDVKDLLSDLVLYSRSKRRYDQIRYINPAGKEVIRINYNGGDPAPVAERDLQNKSHRSYFSESINLSWGQVYISPMDLNVEARQIEVPLKPIIRFATPVFDEDGERNGIVVLNYSASIMLDIIREVDRQFIGTFELLNSDGYWLHSRDPAMEWGFMYPDKAQVSYASEHPELWAQVSSADIGRLSTSECILSFMSIRPLSESPMAEVLPLVTADDYCWKLLAEIPFSSFHAEVAPMRRSLVLLYAVFVLFSLVFSYVIAAAAEKERVVTAEIKTLRGIIPICTMCKKVRDDSGFWHHVETYVRNHTDADFSHSYCPKCFETAMKEADGEEDAPRK